MTTALSCNGTSGMRSMGEEVPSQSKYTFLYIKMCRFRKTPNCNMSVYEFLPLMDSQLTLVKHFKMSLIDLGGLFSYF